MITNLGFYLSLRFVRGFWLHEKAFPIPNPSENIKMRCRAFKTVLGANALIHRAISSSALVWTLAAMTSEARKRRQSRDRPASAKQREDQSNTHRGFSMYACRGVSHVKGGRQPGLRTLDGACSFDHLGFGVRGFLPAPLPQWRT